MNESYNDSDDPSHEDAATQKVLCANLPSCSHTSYLTSSNGTKRRLPCTHTSDEMEACNKVKKKRWKIFH